MLDPGLHHCMSVQYLLAARCTFLTLLHTCFNVHRRMQCDSIYRFNLHSNLLTLLPMARYLFVSIESDLCPNEKLLIISKINS